ncbi:hypothetical protein QZP89_19285 [Citrobacter werkmanii]|uniref:hypothetical protein n=1 Tax=Citrobacter werkmanii TaxID=67827 RepID=UPI00264EF34A|nr:hypothetical protein [Citrobacter werkmanii]MDN8553950.1 hypothetical protein [Citrobacter werkmanii]
MKRGYSKELDMFASALFDGNHDSKNIGKTLVELYVSDKNNKNMRCLFCKIVSRMEPNDMKFTIQWLRHKYSEMRTDFPHKERLCLAISILTPLKKEKSEKLIPCRDALGEALTQCYPFIKSTEGGD